MIHHLELESSVAQVIQTFENEKKTEHFVIVQVFITS